MLLDRTPRTQAFRYTQALRWTTTCLILLAMPRCFAEPSVVEPTTERLHSKRIADGSLVEIHACNATPRSADSRWFVITHGMCGTQSQDRFHQLAEQLVNVFPDSRVLLIDWSQASIAKTNWLGIPNPYPVAKRIQPVAAQAASMLKQLGFQPGKATLIGESFGNWVNAEIARQLGKVERILAMNPASEFGGYAPPDLRPLATTSCSFHTYSVYDTLMPIGHMSVLLESANGTSELSKHTAGVPRLAKCLRAGDDSWLTLTNDDGDSDRHRFTARAMAKGQLVRCDLPMKRPWEQQAETEAPQGPTLPPVFAKRLEHDG